MLTKGTRNFLLAALIVLYGTSGVRAGNGSYEQHLNVKLLPQENSINVTAVLDFPDGWKSGAGIMLDPSAEIHRMTVNGKQVDFSFRSGVVRIDRVERRSERLRISIGYSGVFKDSPPNRPAHDEDPSYGVTASITPQGTFLGAGSGWHPYIPGHPADFRVRVEAPAGTYAVTDGRRISHITKGSVTTSEWRTTLPRRRLALAAGPFVVGESRAGEIPVYTYFSGENRALEQEYLEKSAAYIEMYEKMFSPYPFAKFAVVENFFPTGYGFPSWTLIGGTVLRLPFITETSLGHEIAHSWWGNGVFIDYASGNWSEGLTTYVADHLYKEQESADEARKYRLKILRDHAVLAAGDRGYPVAEFRSRQSAVDQAVGYGKVAMIFHMLRGLLGEDVFLEGLRHLAATRMGRATSWRDIRSSFESVSGRDLTTFFEQWLTRDRGPKLSLKAIKRTRGEDDWTVSGTIVQQAPYYVLDVPLTLRSRDGRTTTTVHAVSGAQTPFRITSTSPPERVQLDPEVQLFRELHPEEVPPLVNTIRGSDDLVVVAAGSLPEKVLDAAAPLIAALRHEAKPVPESALTPEMLAGRDILFLGWPKRFAPSLPSGFGVAKDGFRYKETSYSESGDVLFAALEHSLDETRTAAVYLPLSAGSASLVNRKIPHYGKYSILIFRDGENVVKEAWPTQPGPTLHIFDEEETDADR